MKPVAPGPGDERRSKAGLRALIDEMMTQLRAASNQDVWTPEARALAESDLERIMDTVRRQALRQDAGSAEEQGAGSADERDEQPSPGRIRSR